MSMEVILSVIVCACFAALAWPFAFYPVLLRFFPAKPLVLKASSGLPSAALLFCTYNEAANIRHKIRNLEDIKGLIPGIEILVYDDGSSDGTLDILSGRVDLLTVVGSKDRLGKAHGMKCLSSLTKSQILIFTDANVMLEPQGILNLLAHYTDPEVGGVLGSLRYVGRDASATASVGSLYWRIEEWLKDLESRCGNVIGADGSIFSLRKELYPDFPNTVLDDFTVSMAAVFAGQRLVKATDVVATEHIVTSRHDEYRRKVRIAARGWHTHQFLRPKLAAMSPMDRFKYTSRKLVRWFGGVFLLAGSASALLLLWLAAGPLWALVLLGAGGLFLILGARARRGLAAAVLEIILAYLATLQGIFSAMRGATFSTWTPAQSR